MNEMTNFKKVESENM